MEKSTSEEKDALLAHEMAKEAGKDDWFDNLSNRGKEWVEFATEVGHHIENYTVPQYGDAPDDQMTTASIEDIKHDMQRYINRMGRNARGTEEAIRDMKKLAHYACIAANKLRESDAVS